MSVSIWRSFWFRLLLLAGVVVSSAAGLEAQQWAQWRGPARDGSIPSAAVPAAWPARYEAVWQVEIGEGYSSPVVADGRVFIQSRQDPAEIVTAVDLATGRVLWQQRDAAPYEKNQYAVQMGKGPNATPLVADGRLFTLGATAILTAWDVESGDRLWRTDFSSDVSLAQLFCGTAASPLLVDGRLIVQVGSDVHGGRVVALDPATGDRVWQWEGAGPGYASPIVLEVGATTQIVTMTNGSMVGLDAGTGRELWSAPFPDDWHENIVTPLWTGRHLIVSGTRQGTQAYRLLATGGTWRAERVWQNEAASMYMSTPVSGDGLIYGLSNKRRGYFVALDEDSGEVRWATEGREATNAAVLLAPRDVLFLTDSATLVIASRQATGFDARRIELPAAATWSTPVVLGRDLIVKDATSVIRLAGRD